jgi:predicted O-linked N-acetylglucosamine transferase (SPINDLY family)
MSLIKSQFNELEPKTRQDFNLPSDKIIYLCCQSLWKYLPQYDYVWAAIAKQVPDAQFIFFTRFGKGITSQFQTRLERAFEAYQLNWQDYCSIYSAMQYEQYLQLNQVCDIFLDSFAWSGGITSIDAISCNLPIVTCPGELMRGRQAYGILKQLKIEETIAKDPAQYIQIAIRLGLEPNWRKAIQAKIRRNWHLVFEDLSAVEGLESFYIQTQL